MNLASPIDDSGSFRHSSEFSSPFTPKSTKHHKNEERTFFYEGFSYHVVDKAEPVTPKQSPPNVESEVFISDNNSSSDSEIELNNFERTPEKPDKGSSPAIALTFSSLVKNSAVEALKTQSQRDKSLRSVNDRIYARFFQEFDKTWDQDKLKQSRKRSQKKLPLADFSAAIHQSREALSELENEVRTWENAKPEIQILHYQPKQEYVINPVEFDNSKVKDITFEVDKLSVVVQSDISNLNIIIEAAEDIAAKMNDESRCDASSESILPNTNS